MARGIVSASKQNCPAHCEDRRWLRRILFVVCCLGMYGFERRAERAGHRHGR